MSVLKKYENCTACPFRSRTCGSRGPREALIAIVGESPGLNEIMKDQPFIGLSGELLTRMLKRCGVDESDCYITNAICCLPPKSKDKNGKPVKDARINEAARACRHRLFDELVDLPNLKLVISMGGLALKTMTEAWGTSILKRRGQVIDSVLIPTTTDELYNHGEQLRGAGTPIAPLGVLPTLHPAYILRTPSALPQLQSDLLKAKRLLSGEGYPQPTITYKILINKEAIDKVIADNTRKAVVGGEPVRVVADIETTGLSPQKDSFICIGFQFEHNISETENVVYVVTGKNEGALVDYLFARMPLWVQWVWHNGQFDTAFLRAKGIQRKLARVDHDTLLLSYTLDETGARHSLEQCIVDHLGLPSYKDMLAAYVGTGKNKKSYADVPRPLLYEYMSKDVIFTGLLFKHLAPQVLENTGKPHLRLAYESLLIPAANTLATIELNGMPLDQESLAATGEEIKSSLLPIRKQLIELVQPHINAIPEKLRNRAGGFNPNSPQQLLPVLKSMGFNIRSTDEDTIKKHKGDAFINALLEYRGLQKQLSTYVVAFEKYGSRVHSSYLLHGTVTGRLSSTSPNLQNIPKEGIIRKNFKPTRGRVFVSFDYSQAELRSLAVLSGDKNLIDIFLSGKDMHSAVAADVYGELFTSQPEYLADGKTENPVYQSYRRKAKTVNFGIVYGATEFTLMERLGITWKEANILIKGWFAMFPDARKFMDECRSAPVTGRPLITLFGRQRRFYVTTNQNTHGQENEAGNFPHQSMCSDFTLDAAIQIDKILDNMPRRDLVKVGRPKQVNIIHDDNLFECDDNMDAVKTLVRLVRPIMENTPVKHGITMLPFKSDAKMGYNWSEMQKIAA